MARERPDHTLQPTALVHEAYLRLCKHDPAAPTRPEFVRIAAQAMRRLLINHALDRMAEKRGGGAVRQPLDESIAQVEESSGHDILALHRALARFREVDPRAADVVELRFFGGCTIEETAAALRIGHSTVESDWRTARLWLARELGGA
jgi:RNA polymerase sigma factor (TIGR02999 family)